MYRLPEDSDFKTYAKPPFGRNGDWPELKRMLAHAANEISANRAAKYAGSEHEYQYTVFLSPLESREQAEEAEAEAEFQESEFEALLAQFGDT